MEDAQISSGVQSVCWSVCTCEAGGHTSQAQSVDVFFLQVAELVVPQPTAKARLVGVSHPRLHLVPERDTQRIYTSRRNDETGLPECQCKRNLQLICTRTVQLRSMQLLNSSEAVYKFKCRAACAEACQSGRFSKQACNLSTKKLCRMLTSRNEVRCTDL